MAIGCSKACIKCDPVSADMPAMFIRDNTVYYSANDYGVVIRIAQA